MTRAESRTMTQAGAPPRPGARTGLVLAVACLTQLLVVLDNSIVTIALPAIDSDLGFSRGGLSWVVNAYVLVFGGLLLLGGRIADLVGVRRALFAGLAIFAIASIAGGLAQNPGQLIAARAVQGIAGAALAPVSLTVIMLTFTEQAARQRAFALWAMTAAGGSAVGVFLGGVLTEVDWRWVMFVNVPILGLVGALAWPAVHERRAADHRRLDVPGAILATAALATLVFGVLETERHPWGSTRTIMTLTLAVVVSVAFVLVERRQRHPLVRLNIFTEGHVGIATVITLAVGAATITGFYFCSLFLQNVLHYGPLAAGACFLPFCAGIAIGSFGSRALAARMGLRAVLTGGLLLGGAGLAWFAALDASSTFLAGFLAPSLVASVGLGAAMVANTTLATSTVTADESGLVSGVLNAGRQVGGSIGLAAMTAVAVAATNASPASTGEAALADGYSRAFLITGLLVMIAGVVAAARTGGRTEASAAAPGNPG